MPWFKKGPRDRTLVFDAFVALDRGDEVIFLWPEVTLDTGEEEVLSLVLSQLSYFGRAESWCTARLSQEWVPLDHGRWAQINHATGEIMAEINCVLMDGDFIPDGQEPVRVLMPHPSAWKEWSYGKKAKRPDPPWNLLAETADLHAERWSDPPGSRWVTYLRPTGAFAVQERRRRTERMARSLTMARYALDGAVLPLVQETLALGELARQYLQGIYGRQNGGAPSWMFSGKATDGTPLRDHRHASFLPTDEDDDGRLDHLTVYERGALSPDGRDQGFTEAELRALAAFRRLRQPGGKPDLRLVLLGIGGREDWTHTPLLGPARRWRSCTPFIPPRHQKTRGRKRETPVEQLCDELRRRGFPAPVAVHEVPRCEVNGRSLRWIEFRRERLLGGGSRGQGPGYGFAIEFAERVVGPLCLGYACHFGLGLFLPVMA
jgi:CRISPR-associated protein Csb2